MPRATGMKMSPTIHFSSDHLARDIRIRSDGVDDHIPYTRQALEQDLFRVQNAWDDCQSSRSRDAIYDYLTAVFDLVAWWAADRRDVERVKWALRIHGSGGACRSTEPFTAIIFCTADPAKVDKRARSKWSRALRYALECKSDAEPLTKFLKRKGGINECAARFTRLSRKYKTRPPLWN